MLASWPIVVLILNILNRRCYVPYRVEETMGHGLFGATHPVAGISQHGYDYGLGNRFSKFFRGTDYSVYSGCATARMRNDCSGMSSLGERIGDLCDRLGKSRVRDVEGDREHCRLDGELNRLRSDIEKYNRDLEQYMRDKESGRCSPEHLEERRAELERRRESLVDRINDLEKDIKAHEDKYGCDDAFYSNGRHGNIDDDGCSIDERPPECKPDPEPLPEPEPEPCEPCEPCCDWVGNVPHYRQESREEW